MNISTTHSPSVDWWMLTLSELECGALGESLRRSGSSASEYLEGLQLPKFSVGTWLTARNVALEYWVDQQSDTQIQNSQNCWAILCRLQAIDSFKPIAGASYTLKVLQEFLTSLEARLGDDDFNLGYDLLVKALMSARQYFSYTTDDELFDSYCRCLFEVVARESLDEAGAHSLVRLICLKQMNFHREVTRKGYPTLEGLEIFRAYSSQIEVLAKADSSDAGKAYNTWFKRWRKHLASEPRSPLQKSELAASKSWAWDIKILREKLYPASEVIDEPNESKLLLLETLKSEMMRKSDTSPLQRNEEFEFKLMTSEGTEDA